MEDVGEMARRERKHGDDSDVALADKERNTTVVTGLVSRVMAPRHGGDLLRKMGHHQLLWQRYHAFILSECSAQRPLLA